MSYIDGTESSPSKSLYYKIETNINEEGKETRSYSGVISLELRARYSDRLSEFNRNNKKALAACQKCKHCHVPQPPDQPPALYTECIYTGVTHPSTFKSINTHSTIITSHMPGFPPGYNTVVYSSVIYFMILKSIFFSLPPST
jgi:hypothetical protein